MIQAVLSLDFSVNKKKFSYLKSKQQAANNVVEQEFRDNPRGKILNFLEKGTVVLTPLILACIVCPVDGNRQLPTEPFLITTGSL